MWIGHELIRWKQLDTHMGMFCFITCKSHVLGEGCEVFSLMAPTLVIGSYMLVKVDCTKCICWSSD